MSEQDRHVEHVPHPHIEKRKDFLRQREDEVRGINAWLAVKITNMVGTMWCAYAFAALTLISLPEAIKGGVATLVAWIAQTFLQLVLLSIIMVGQKVQAKKSDEQLDQTYNDAEALLQISDEVHKLIKQNVSLTQQVDKLLRENTQLTEGVSALLHSQA
jgi:hypothetical protein